MGVGLSRWKFLKRPEKPSEAARFWNQDSFLSDALFPTHGPLLASPGSDFGTFLNLLYVRSRSFVGVHAPASPLFCSDLPFPDAERPPRLPTSGSRVTRYWNARRARKLVNSTIAYLMFLELGCPSADAASEILGTRRVTLAL